MIVSCDLQCDTEPQSYLVHLESRQPASGQQAGHVLESVQELRSDGLLYCAAQSLWRGVQEYITEPSTKVCGASVKPLSHTSGSIVEQPVSVDSPRHAWPDV